MSITTDTRSKTKMKEGDLESMKKGIQDLAFKIAPEILTKVEELAKKGMSRKHIQDYFGITEFKWGKKSIQKVGLERSYLKGRSIGISFTSTKLMEQVKEGNLDAVKFFLSRIAKYSEAPESDTNEPNDQKNKQLIINVTDPVEASKIYQQFMQRSGKDE